MRRLSAAGWRLALGLAAAWASGGCASAPRESPTQALAAEVARFLADPSPLASPPTAPTLASLHDRLLAGEPSSRLEQELERIPATAEDRPAVEVSRAQLEFARGAHAAAEARLAGLPPATRSSSVARLLEARLAELAGRAVDAFFLYDALARELGAAEERREAVRASARLSLARAIESAIELGRFDAAALELDRLERVAPRDETMLVLAARVASARGDGQRELDAVRSLAAAHPDRLSLQLRRGELEVEVGEPAAGLELLERLATAHPGDAEVTESLARGKFVYRLANAPEEVRAVARRAQLTRADFARLLFWLVPSVRSAKPAATRIASDALDHPAREEIVRVANLGLLPIDEALHRFDPDRVLTRLESFLALARLRGAAAQTRADGCRHALASRWIAEEASCLPSAPVGGDDAVEWVRQSTAEEGEN